MDENRKRDVKTQTAGGKTGGRANDGAAKRTEVVEPRTRERSVTRPDDRREVWTQEQRRAMLAKKYITAKVVSFDEGLTTIERVRAVRIISEKFTLLIMDEFMPVIGVVDGEVTFVCESREQRYKYIHGFFCHRNNEFSLLIQED